MSSKIFTIIGALLVTALFVAAVGLGVWGYNLNNQLTQSQADNKALQAKYDDLSAEYTQAQLNFKAQSEKAAAELAQTQGELTTAQAQIAKLEGDLKKSQDGNAELQANLEAIKSKVDILNTFWFKSTSAFEKKVENSGDSKLVSLYANYKKSANTNNFLDLFNYMIESIADASGVN